MSACLPFAGMKALIPRGKKQAKSFVELVRENGGVPVAIPLLAFRPVLNEERIRPIINDLSSYDWLIFTSITAVETFFTFLPTGQEITSKVAAIGEKTAQALAEKGVNVDFFPSEYVAEGFVKEFLPLVHEGEKVLVPKGNLARNVIASSLREKRVHADEITIYETYFPEESKSRLLDVLHSEKLDILFFTSPSTVEHFMSVVDEHNFRDKIADSVIACIGPIAKRRAESFGLQVDVMPKVYTVPELIRATVSFLRKEP